MKKIIITVLAALSFGFVTSCSSNKENGEVEHYTLSLNYSSYSLYEEDSFIISAITNAPGSVSFSSENNAIASVSSSGRVIAKKAGTTRIVAVVDSLKEYCNLTVSPLSDKAVDYIRCDQTEYVIGLNEQTSYTITPSYYSNGEVVASAKFSFTSNDSTIAEVTENGEIVPHKEGTVSVSISANNISANVFLDIYTINMKTTGDWMEMLGTLERKDARFILNNDLDFSGVSYHYLSGYDETTWECSYLMGEINGNYHTISHITMDSKVNKQSIFGFTTAITVKNIAFKSVKFTSETANCGLFVSLMHHVTELNGVGEKVNNIYTTLVSNIICDFSFSNVYSTVIAENFYGGGVENVFACVRNNDGSALTSKKGFAVARNFYLWWDPNYLNNIICYVPNGTLAIEPSSGLSNASILNTVYVTDSLIEADYLAANSFDNNVWNIEPNTIPTFK